jgi:predicted DNA-binding transcriptional regulator AlpA
METTLLKEREVASRYGLSVPWLRRARVERRGPPFLRVHRRMIRYRRADIEAFLESRVVDACADQRLSDYVGGGTASK